MQLRLVGIRLSFINCLVPIPQLLARSNLPRIGHSMYEFNSESKSTTGLKPRNNEYANSPILTVQHVHILVPKAEQAGPN